MSFFENKLIAKVLEVFIQSGRHVSAYENGNINDHGACIRFLHSFLYFPITFIQDYLLNYIIIAE